MIGIELKGQLESMSPVLRLTDHIQMSTLAVALLAMSFSWGMEFSQFYHAPWIDAVRATLPGRLVLGNTYNWPDLLAYAVGVALGALAERRLRRKSSNVAR